MKKRVVIAGFGDTGLLVAVHLGSGFEVVGVSPKPCLVSGQELGVRLTEPDAWQQDYLMDFGRYRKLDGVRVLQGLVSKVDAVKQNVHVDLASGGERVEPYDVLVIASGVTNGFWRNAEVEALSEIKLGVAGAARRIARASEIAIVGGGATGVSVAANVAERVRDTRVHLFYAHEQPLPGYHPDVRDRVEARLRKLGVLLHPRHRARVPDGFRGERMTTDAVEWSTGQPAFTAELTLWAVGHTTPNSAFVPESMLDEGRFVAVDEYLRVPGYPNVFAVGDIAASDANRSSARNWGHRLVAHNIRCLLRDDAESMKRYEAPKYRWGSVFGVQDDGLEVFQPSGRRIRFPRWLVRLFLFPIAVRRAIYKGVRRAPENP